MGIGTEIVPSSTVYQNAHLKGQDRILDICKQEQADHYINPIGGMELYDKGKFEKRGIKLDFIKSILSPYPQFKNAFRTLVVCYRHSDVQPPGRYQETVRGLLN